MQYRQFPGTDVTASTLGFGCMRFPTRETGEIDRERAVNMLHHAIDSGVTYIDTAYPYHGGESETVVGEALSGGWREKVTLTTKLPLWKVEKYEDMENILDEQLTKLRTDHVDFYLLHAMRAETYRKMRDLGAYKFLDDMVKKGKIRYPGFSFHDNADIFAQIAQDYDWKLIQVQMNLLDEFNQATYAGVQKYAAERGIGVVVMEPLRGGALARTAPKEVQAIYDAADEKRSPVEWAFRWLLDKPEFVTILSGMSTEEQLDDNLRIFDSAQPHCLTDEQRDMLARVRKAYEQRIRVGCTGCAYCQPCPRGVLIPRIFGGYDNACMFGEGADFKLSYARIAEQEGGADRCVECGACEKQCPQHIAIRRKLAEIREEMSAQ